MTEQNGTGGEGGSARERLLAAAAHEFAEKGISGARVDAIAGRAGVNKQLLYYYFGSKDGLYRAFLQERLARPKSVPTDENPTLGERMSRVTREHLDDGDHLRLLMWEALEVGTEGEVAEEEARAAHYAEMVERVRAAQEAGEIPADLDPAQILLSRMAQVMFPVAFPQLARLVTGRSIDDPEFVESRLRHLRRIYDGADAGGR